jgi:hypothetical protein
VTKKKTDIAVSDTSAATSAPVAQPKTHVDIKDPPFIVGNKRIVRLDTRRLTANEHVACFNAAMVGLSPGESFIKPWNEETVRARVTAVADDGSNVPLTRFDIGSMHISYGLKIHAMCSDDTTPPGEIIGKGDGTLTPILYRLGSPFQVTRNGEVLLVEEVEFLVSTYRDILDVLSADYPWQKALVLATRRAKAMGPNGSFDLLPTEVADGLMQGDLYAIQYGVLPSFLPRQEE